MEALKNDIKCEMRDNKVRPDRIYGFMLRVLDILSAPPPEVVPEVVPVEPEVVPVEPEVVPVEPEVVHVEPEVVHVEPEVVHVEPEEPEELGGPVDAEPEAEDADAEPEAGEEPTTVKKSKKSRR